MKIALVGCGKEKLGHAAPACELYTGPLFRAARRWAETFADRWFILSAQHGLLDPDAVIEPYDLKLSQLSREERERWAEWTTAQIAEVRTDDTKIIAFAGGDYINTLRNDGCGAWRWSILDPLERLEVGQRLAWFKRAMLAGHAIRRMRAAEAAGAFGRVELTGPECEALFELGACASFTSLEFYQLDPSPDRPARVGAGVQMTFPEAA